MFDIMGEAAANQVHRAFTYGSRMEKAVWMQKAERLREARPIQHSGACEVSRPMVSDNSGQNRTRLEGGKILIEQYDKSGRLLKMTPPGYLPFSEVI